MCGIAGVLDSDPGRAAATTRAINGAQGHRGPDHVVMARVGDVTLGNTRLAIQDPSPAGNQPFVSADGRYTCVFNGEIYNYQQLAERYQLPLTSGCDGEVIPALWGKLGIDALAELRGMYAIALWDNLAECLYLARDQFGIKPLYWRALPGDGLAFASEARPLAAAGPAPQLDPGAIAHYLRFGAMAADQSPFREVTMLPPGTVAIVGRDRRVTPRPVPVPAPRTAAEDGPLAGGGGQARARLGAALTDSIRLHLGADAPTALLLSSGVDSAAICAVARRLGRDLDCLTVGIGGEADEAAGAARTARRYGHRFQRVEASLRPGDVAGFFAAMQRPTVDGLNTYLISRAVHEAGFKVALSGLGGDEAVGGYSHFRLLRLLPLLRALDRSPGGIGTAAAVTLARAGAVHRGKAARLLGAGGPRDGAGLVLLQRELLPAQLVTSLTGVSQPGSGRAPRGAGEFAAMRAAEVWLYLQSMLLPDADAFSMAWSVEMRVPFVDQEVMTAALASRASPHRPAGKTAFGTALGDPFLRGLARQPKRGFSVPMRSWLAGPLAPVVAAADDPGAPVWSLVDRQAAAKAGLVPSQPRERWTETWALAALNSWLTTGQAQR